MKNFLVVKFLILITFVLIFFSNHIIFAQNKICSIKIYPIEYPEQFQKFHSYIFKINGTLIDAADTTNTQDVVINKYGLDSCMAILEGDTTLFLAKFRENQTYTIQAGSCCCNFSIEPNTKNNIVGRGTLKFYNQSNNKIIFGNAGLNAVFDQKSKDYFGGIIKLNPKSSTQWLNSIESAMCYYKLFGIDVYKNTKNINNLKKSLDTIYFQFLHQEKLNLFYDAKTKKISLKLDESD